MNIKIEKETIFDELVKLLGKIFALPEVRKVKIREYEIFSEKEVGKIKNALQESYHDILSDVDVGVQVTLHPADFGTDFPYHNNPGRIGLDRETYLGLAYSGAGEFQMLRLILKSGIRFDIGFYITLDEYVPILSIPRKEKEEAKKEGRFWPYWDLQKADEFWFTQIQALAKLYRGDYLIADHLANLMLNETLVAQMVMRDDEYGTNFHRYGYHELLEYQMAGPIFFALQTREEGFMQIAHKLYAAAITYDKLVKSLNPFYEEQRDCFFSIWQNYDVGVNS